MEDGRGVLSDERPFTYTLTKGATALVKCRGKNAGTLVGRDYDKLCRLDAAGDAYAIQLFLAKATGHFKH